MFKKILRFLFIGIIFIGCDSSTNPELKEKVEISFPLGKKAVYASANYFEKIGGRELASLKIYSVEYTSKSKDINNLYEGEIEAVYYFSEANPSPLDSSFFPYTGSLTVTVDSKWVKFQKSNVYDLYNIFMKVNAANDTTELPTENFSQFPVYPSIIETNSKYSIYRPQNYGEEWGYIGVVREFSTKDLVSFSDYYGESSGIYVNTNHTLLIGNNNSLKFTSIIDTQGLVISQNTSSLTITDADGSEIESVISNTINRRIVNFTEPENVRELNYYLELVKQNGIELIDF